MVDAHRLRTFLSVMASGSVNAAAGHLGYSPSAVSQQIAALQKETGLTLFTRHGRGIEPTPAAHTLAAESEQLMTELKRVDAVVDVKRKEAQGQYDLFGSDIFGGGADEPGTEQTTAPPVEPITDPALADTVLRVDDEVSGGEVEGVDLVALAAGADALDRPAPLGLYLAVELVARLVLGGPGFLAPFLEGVEAAFLTAHLAPVDPQGRPRQPPQERAVVRDQHESRPRLGQLLFQPADRLDVQVVGGLVQQHQFRRLGQQPRQRRPPPARSKAETTP